MKRSITVAFGGFWTFGLMIIALWTWHNSRVVATMWGAAKPDVAAWSMCSLAIGLICLAQVILVTFVVGAIYRQDLITRGLRILGAVGLVAALFSTTALWMAGR